MAARFPFFTEKQIQPAWSFDAGTLLWRICFTSSNLIVGETRHQETKTTKFFCLDLRSGNPVWQNREFDEPWWIGIETVHKRWLILHGYVRPDMPEHRGIWVIDIESGRLLWRNDALSFWFVENELLFAHKYIFDKHIGCEFEINTGALLKEQTGNLEEMQEIRQKVLQNNSEEQKNIIFPEVYEEHEADSSVRPIVRCMTKGKALEGWTEYLVYRDSLILSQYRNVQTQSEPSLMDNILSVYDMKKEKIRYSEIIDRGVKAPSPDSFFIKDDTLLFIKYQSVLTALQPWKY
jgi:hypothetical protein